jgi:hypothetical protein
MTEPSDTRSGLPTWFLLAILAIAALGVAGVTTALAVALSDDGDADAASQGQAPGEDDAGVFVVKGELSLIDFDGGVDRYQGQCLGSDGYEDLVPGAQVTIRDSKGETLAVGALDAGWPDGPGTCVFPFVVNDVPAGEEIYSVEVSHRGEISFTQDEAGQGRGLSLTLG